MIDLLAMTGNRIEETAKALSQVCQAMPYGFFRNVRLLSPHAPENFMYDWIEIPALTREQWEEWQVKRMADYTDADFLLSIQWDSGVSNPDKWNWGFLQYDYVGAPWRADMLEHGTNRVGNDGFCLRSRAWLERGRTISDRPYLPMNSDVWMVQWGLDHFAGLTVAPLEVAAEFAIESDIPEYPGRTRADCFGFHGGNP